MGSKMKLALFNTLPNKPWFLRVYSTSPLKTQWEKEKWLVTSNFSFSHSVFYPFGDLSAIFVKFEIGVCKVFQFGRVQNLSFGKGLTLYQTIPTFDDPGGPWFEPLAQPIFFLRIDDGHYDRIHSSTTAVHFLG